MELQSRSLELTRSLFEISTELRVLNEWAACFDLVPTPPPVGGVIVQFRPRQLAEAAS